MTVVIDEEIIKLLKSEQKLSTRQLIQKLEKFASSQYIVKRLRVLTDQRQVKLIQNSASLDHRIYVVVSTEDEVSLPEYQLKAIEFAQDLSSIDEPVTLTSYKKPKGVYLPKHVFKELCKKAGVTNVN